MHRLNDQVVILLKVPPSTLPVLHSLRIMQLGAVVQLKLDGPSNNLILTARKHVATSLDVVTDHLIVNKAVATIVKSEVRICKTSCALHCTHLDACVLRGSYGQSNVLKHFACCTNAYLQPMSEPPSMFTLHPMLRCDCKCIWQVGPR